jgi:MFS family permease
MAVTADLPLSAAEGDRLARRNAIVLGVAQALAGANNTVIVTTGGIVGSMLAPDKGLATLPITMFVMGMWLGTLPVGAMAKSVGRRFSLQVASGFGIVAGFISCYAVLQASFPLFLLGAFFCGLYGAGHQSYRFAAADTASESFRPKAISWVLAGGIFAGVIGPQLIIFTKDSWPPFLFAATYIGQSAVAALAAVVLMFVKIPRPHRSVSSAPGRPLWQIVRQPRFLVAVACGVAPYTMMNMVMTSAPLAMIACDHTMTDAALGMQWHILAMFAPSFFTGSLMARFGVERLTGLGLAILIVSGVVAMAGITLWHFWGALILLGFGWNFGFIGATSMVTRCYRPEERNKVQSFNDFLIFGSLALSSLASGKLLVSFGWEVVNGVLFPVIVIAGGLLIWLVLRDRSARAAA